MKLKSVLNEETKLRNFRLPKADWEMIQKKADKYTDGNVTQWIRYAATQHEPKASDIVKNEKRKKSA